MTRNVRQLAEKADLTVAQCAELFEVPKRSIERARTIKRHGMPQVFQALQEGKISLHLAEKITKLPPHIQIEIVSGDDPGRIRQIAHQRIKDASPLTVNDMLKDIDALLQKYQHYEAFWNLLDSIQKKP